MDEFLTQVMERYYQIAGSGRLSKWLLPKTDWAGIPQQLSEGPKTERLQLEIVSHCWKYSHLLAYQLSSLVLYAPKTLDVTFTVFHSAEDAATVKLLDFFGDQRVPAVEWNWWPIEKERLFRRAIGRNLAARATDADWIWFTDCDQVFHQGCLDALPATLRSHEGHLLFPKLVSCTSLLPGDDPMLSLDGDAPRLVDIDPTRFRKMEHEKAIGALQIVRGDVARSIGYCDTIGFFQRPVGRWRKCYEDRIFRCLVGSQGEAIDLPNLFRIEHVEKGRKRQALRAA